MRARDVISIWRGWDSPDVFEVDEVSKEGRLVYYRGMTGLDFLNSELADREIRDFGTYGKGPDGTWRHHVVVAAEETPESDSEVLDELQDAMDELGTRAEGILQKYKTYVSRCPAIESFLKEVVRAAKDNR